MTKGMGNKLCGRQRRLPMIASRKAWTADVQVAGNPGRHRVEMAIQDIHLHVGDRPPDRNGLQDSAILSRSGPVGTRGDRGFSRPIGVTPINLLSSRPSPRVTLAVPLTTIQCSAR